MSARAALQAAIVRTLAAYPALGAIADGLAHELSYPFVLIADVEETNRSVVGRQGLEIRIKVRLMDDQAPRISEGQAIVSAALQEPLAVAGWDVGHAMILDIRHGGDGHEPWSSTTTMRYRLLAKGEGQ